MHPGYWLPIVHTILFTFRIQEHGRPKKGRRAAAACFVGTVGSHSADLPFLLKFSKPFCFYSRRRSVITFVLRSVVMLLTARYRVVTGDWGSLPR